ncbi:MAG: SufE family protein [Bacteroidales bacterium]|jgi:cysteine desulfuration protein SufE|nr:SufE family protein [Bacteroidales bacterium]
MTIKEKTDSIVSKFGQFSDWMDKYQLLIEMGKDAPILKDEEKLDKYLIKGCQSRLWLKAELSDGKIKFSVNSDAVITLGIASLLIYVFNGQTPATVLETPVDFIDRIGLREHLSPTRSNGLTAMIKQMKLYAMAFSMS